MKKILEEITMWVCLWVWLATSIVGFVALWSKSYAEAAAYFSLACMHYLILTNLENRRINGEEKNKRN